MTARITVAQLAATTDERFARLEAALADIAKGVTVLATAAYATPAPVIAITEAPSYDAERVFAEPSHAGKTTRTRKAPAKATARKATTKATTKTVVTTEQAQALVAAGGDQWKIFVASNTTGEPIPYGKVARALKAQARKDAPVAAKPAVKPTKATKALGTSASVYFAMSKSALVADGSKGAQAELDRRAAKKATKSA